MRVYMYMYILSRVSALPEWNTISMTTQNIMLFSSQINRQVELSHIYFFYVVTE